VIQLLLTWGVSLRKNVLRSSVNSLAMWFNFSQPWDVSWRRNKSRLSMTSLAMWSNFSLSEASFRGGMSLGSPWPHWPCDPTSNFMRRLFQNEWVTFLYDLVGHVLHPLLTWGAGSRTNVSRLFMTFLTMCSNFCLPEALVRGRMCRGSPWPHWPCAPAPPYPAGDGLKIHHLKIQPLILDVDIVIYLNEVGKNGIGL